MKTPRESQFGWNFRLQAALFQPLCQHRVARPRAAAEAEKHQSQDVESLALEHSMRPGRGARPSGLKHGAIRSGDLAAEVTPGRYDHKLASKAEIGLFGVVRGQS